MLRPEPDSALILVDLQNDFLPGGALPVREGNQVVPVANRLMPLFQIVVATQDWHPATHLSFAANHPGRQPGEIIDLNGLPQVLWPVHCVRGSSGAAFATALDQTRVTRVFQKGVDPDIDGYSGLFDNGHRRSTGLGEFLRGKDVTTVFVLGLATDYCVKFTALDAIDAGFKVNLVEEGCRGVELQPGDTARAIEQLRERGVRLVKNAKELATDG